MIQIEAVIPESLVDPLETHFYDLDEVPWMVQQARDEDPYKLVGWFDSEEAALLQWCALRNRFPGIPADPVVGVLPDRDWKEAYKEHFRPWVERGLHWVPEWERATHVVPAGEAAIYLDPGMAFGTGDHPTTRLCAAAILDVRDRLGAQVSRARVVDAGCGSGILALSAAKLGFGSVEGFDIDPEAVRVSRGNAEANGLGGRVAFREAGLDGGLKSGPWDLVLANILANILCANAEVLLRATAPGGTLALSGILEREAAQASAHFQSAADRLGMAVEMRTLVLGEWAGIHIERY